MFNLWVSMLTIDHLQLTSAISSNLLVNRSRWFWKEKGSKELYPILIFLDTINNLSKYLRTMDINKQMLMVTVRAFNLSKCSRCNNSNLRTSSKDDIR